MFYSESSTQSARAKDAEKSVLLALGGPVSLDFGQRVSPLPMPGIELTAGDQTVPADLIGFLKAIPDGRYRRGAGCPTHLSPESHEMAGCGV